jgi:hypothetical protein
MSANNWTVCPKCKAEAKRMHAEKEATLAKSYGKVPAETWLAMQAEVATVHALEETLREGWDLGVDEEGRFYVSYRCSCDACNFTFTFKQERQLEIDA